MSNIFDVGFVQKSDKIKNIELRNKVIATLKASLEKLPNYRDLQHNLEALNYCCNIIENLIDNKNKKNKIDKKELLIEALKIIYGSINEKMIGEYIDFLYDNGRIKKEKIINVISHTFLNFFRKSQQ